MLAVRIGEQYTIEEWKRKMESEGYQWKDFNPETKDPEFKKMRHWYYNNRGKVIVNDHAWHIDAPGLIFYKINPNYTPTPDHPLKGKGKFKAIYLHGTYPLSPVSLVEAEIININANITYLDGAPLDITWTTPSRLLTYDPSLYDCLKGMYKTTQEWIEEWNKILSESLLSQMSVIPSNNGQEEKE